jgi:hypothetical protein
MFKLSVLFKWFFTIPVKLINSIHNFLFKKIKMSKFTKTSKTRYDYNLTIMKSPKPATDTIYPHIKF